MYHYPARQPGWCAAARQSDVMGGRAPAQGWGAGRACNLAEPAVDVHRTQGLDQPEPDIGKITAVRVRGMHTHDNAARNPCAPHKGGVTGRCAPCEGGVVAMAAGPEAAVATQGRRAKAKQLGPAFSPSAAAARHVVE
jgi:hypothetical protein